MQVKIDSKYLVNVGDMFFRYFQTTVAVRRCSVKKLLLEILQNLQENTSTGVSFLKKLQATCSFITTKTTAQVLSCRSCEIFKNCYFEELE